MNIKLPDWYIELYTTVPLIGAEFGVQEDEPVEDYDGVSYVMWGSIDDIIIENTKYEPGISVLKDGYIFVASCSHGSGDPLFVKLNAEEARIYLIYHDDLTKSPLAENIGSLFRNAKGG